jgi:hypothetical protein
MSIMYFVQESGEQLALGEVFGLKAPNKKVNNAHYFFYGGLCIRSFFFILTIKIANISKNHFLIYWQSKILCAWMIF